MPEMFKQRSDFRVPYFNRAQRMNEFEKVMNDFCMNTEVNVIMTHPFPAYRLDQLKGRQQVHAAFFKFYCMLLQFYFRFSVCNIVNSVMGIGEPGFCPSRIDSCKIGCVQLEL